MTERLFSWYEWLILRRPRTALALTALVVAAMAWFATGIKLDASADSLVLEGDKALQYYRKISRRYETEDFLVVTYTPHENELFSQPVLEEIKQLRNDLRQLEGTSSVVSILDVPLLQSPTVSITDIAEGDLTTLQSGDPPMELVREEFRDSPLYSSMLVSPDGKTTALQVNLKRDERYHDLLQARQELREKRREQGLTSAEREELKRREEAFSQYAEKVNQRQRELVTSVRDVLANYRDADVTVFLGGIPMIAADMIRFVKNDLATFGFGIFALMLAILAVIFRHWVWVVIPLASCGATAAFMLGLVTVIDWPLTVISSNFIAILLIITLSITIHLVVRYRELLGQNTDADQYWLVRETTRLMAKPCIYTALTTLVAFASLVVSDIRPVIDFGHMLSLGVLVGLTMAFIILPTALLLLPKPPVMVTGTGSVSLTIRFARFAERFGPVILAGSAVLVALSIWGILRLEVENRFIDYFDESTEIYQGMLVIDEELGGTIPLEIIIDARPQDLALPGIDAEPADGGDQASAAAEEFEDVFGDTPDDFADDFGDGDFADDFGANGQAAPTSYWFTRAGLSRIEAVHDYLASLPETGKVVSLATLYKLMKIIVEGNIDDIQLAFVQRSLGEDIRPILIEPYLSPEGDQARLVVRVKETSRALNRDELIHEIRRHLVDDLGFAEDQVHLTGMLVLYNNMLQSLYRSQILTLGAVFVAITIMFVLLFRSLYISVLAIAPTLLAAGAVLGGMGLFGLPLDIMTVTIAAITVGIGVDDTIHYVHRFRSEFPKDRNYIATMYRCHGSIGKAMYYTSMVIILGFSILVLSNFTPSILFGLLTGLAMFAALMGALLLLPLLIIVFKPLGPGESNNG